MNRDQRTRHNQHWLEEAILGGVSGGLLVGAALFVLMVLSLVLMGTGNAGDALLLMFLFPIVMGFLISKLK